MRHDENQNSDCGPDAGYIMAPKAGWENMQKVARMGVFSPCSSSGMRNVLRMLEGYDPEIRIQYAHALFRSI